MDGLVILLGILCLDQTILSRDIVIHVRDQTILSLDIGIHVWRQDILCWEQAIHVRDIGIHVWRQDILCWGQDFHVRDIGSLCFGLRKRRGRPHRLRPPTPWRKHNGLRKRWSGLV